MLSYSDPDQLRETIKGKFMFKTDVDTHWTAVLFDFPESTNSPLDEDDSDDIEEELLPIKLVEILRIYPSDDVLEIFPLTKFAEKNFATRKYRRIRSISLEGFGLGNAVEDDEGLLELLANLPIGFIQNPDYGLGLWKQYRFIIEAIEEIESITHLQISRTQPTSISGETFILNFSRYDSIRKGINNIHNSALASARVDKSIFAYNSIPHIIDGNTYPERHRPYKKDVIFKAVEGHKGENLSDKDQLAAVALVENSKSSLIKNHPAKLIQLQREIEIVTLKELIGLMETMLTKKLNEPAWQKFFVDHPFILSLAFALPIIIIGDQISVGGRTFSGKGEKITDFFGKNHLTDNLTLIEIKTPQTTLLGRQYRGEVYCASTNLVAAVTQVLDQRHKLNAELPIRKTTSRQYDLEAYAIRCLIVIGTTPEHHDQKKSLELFRSNLHDVTVITFDELLEKLRHVHKYLTDEPTPDSDTVRI